MRAEPPRHPGSPRGPASSGPCPDKAWYEYFYVTGMAKKANAETDAVDVNRRGSRNVQDVCRSGQWSFTSRPLLHVSHTWVLERNALLGCQWKLLNSRKFASPHDQDVIWTLSLEVDYPPDNASPYSLRTPELVRVCVAYSTDVPHKRLHFRAVLHAQQEASATTASPASSLPASSREALADMTLAHPIQREHVGDVYVVASDRSLTIRVEIDYLTDDEDAQAGPASVSLRVPACSLVQDMEALLAGGAMADVVLVAEGEGREWRAHKAVLAARSPVFAAMFGHDMAEKKASRVAVGDVSGDVFDQVLRYMYTGRADHIRTLGVDVLAVADRYALPRLKALCEEELAGAVLAENALDVLVTADLHNAELLREAALQCVCANLHLLLGSTDWAAVTRAHPHLLHAVLAKCVNLSPPRPGRTE